MLQTYKSIEKEQIFEGTMRTQLPLKAEPLPHKYLLNIDIS